MNKNENKIPEDMLPNPVSIDNDVHPDLMGEVFEKTQDNETCECIGECTCKKGHNQKDNDEDSPGLNDEDENTCHCDGDCTCNKPKEVESVTEESKTCECQGDCTCNKPKENDDTMPCGCKKGECTCDKSKDEEDYHQIDTGKINSPVSMDNDLHMKEEVFSSEGDETLDTQEEKDSVDLEKLNRVMEHKRKEFQTDTSDEEEVDALEQKEKMFMDIQNKHDN